MLYNFCVDTWPLNASPLIMAFHKFDNPITVQGGARNAFVLIWPIFVRCLFLMSQPSITFHQRRQTHFYPDISNVICRANRHSKRVSPPSHESRDVSARAPILSTLNIVMMIVERNALLIYYYLLFRRLCDDAMQIFVIFYSPIHLPYFQLSISNPLFFPELCFQSN